jgi:hypothetical protein
LPIAIKGISCGTRATSSYYGLISGRGNLSTMSTSVAQAQSIAAAPTTAVTDWIERHRRIWFAIVALFLIVSFNGKWHLGPDSAGYRQLGHNLATTGRYFFRTDIPGVDQYHNEQGTRYPGLPIVLAILERIFGKKDLPPLVLMMGSAVLSLVLIYRVMLYRLPRWLAICVVVGVGTNPRFIQYANEILSDMPFLLGVLVTLLGFEQVMHAGNRRSLCIGILNTFIGLLIAAAMRPTFMMLGAALIAACLWSIIRGRVGTHSQTPLSAPPFTQDQHATSHAVRWRAAVLIGALILAMILFITLIDIRSRQSGILSGGYEERMVSKLRNFDNKVAPLLPGNIGELLEDALPMAIWGCRAGWGLVPLAGHHLGFGTGFSLIILTSAICLARRNMLWGMFVLVTVLALIFAGPVPRYFLMILPLLLAGWGLFIQWLAQRFHSPIASRFAMCFGLFFLVAFNTVVGSNFLLTQRGFGKLFDARHHWTGLHHVGFIHAFDFGRWADYDKLGKAIHDATKPRDKIVGPNANVLTFLSDRQVYEPVLGTQTKAAGKLFNLAIFPAEEEWHQSKGEYEQMLKQFLRTLHKQASTVVAGPDANLKLAELAPIPSHRLTKAQRIEHARRMAIKKQRQAAMSTAPSNPQILPPAPPSTQP